MTDLNSIKKRIFIWILKNKDKNFKYRDLETINGFTGLRKVMERYQMPEELIFLKVKKI